MTKNVKDGLFKPELWSKLLLRDIMDYGVMLDCVNRNYEGEINNSGDTVHIQKVGNIKVNTHSDDTPIAYQELDGDETTLLIDQKKNFGFKVSDIDKVQSNVQLMKEYSTKAKKEVVNVKDVYLHTLGLAGVAATNQMGSIAVTAENIYDTFVDLFVLLSDSNAIDKNGKGSDGKRPFLILPPKIVGMVKKSPEAKNGTSLGDETMRKGAIMEFAGFDIKQATTIKETEGYDILAGTSEAITYAEQITKVESVKDKDYFGDFVRGLYLYGGKVVESNCLASAKLTVTKAGA